MLCWWSILNAMLPHAKSTIVVDVFCLADHKTISNDLPDKVDQQKCRGIRDVNNIRYDRVVVGGWMRVA